MQAIVLVRYTDFRSKSPVIIPMPHSLARNPGRRPEASYTWILMQDALSPSDTGLCGCINTGINRNSSTVQNKPAIYSPE